MLKKIISRLLLLVIILVVSNVIYSKFFYEKDIQKHSEIVNLVRAVPDSADIIYIGESSNSTPHPNDIDKRKISEFISDYYPELNVYDITKPATHAGIFKTLLRNIPKENQVKTIVLTLNLRSFNAEWIYSGLETPLRKSMVLLKPYPALYNRFVLSFKAYDIKTEQERSKQVRRKWEKSTFQLPFPFEFKNVIEWDNWMANTGKKDENGNIDHEKTILACHYIKTYAFQIDTLSNPRIKDFDEIIELAQQRGWNLVFNLMAENTEKAQELVGDDLIYIINKNAQILEDYYTRKGVLVVNNLNAVEDNQFIDRNWTTEHYAEKGRKIVAKNVAEHLKLWWNNDFKAVDNSVKTTFFYDCEITTINQNYVSSSEKVYSGNKSSKTGNGNDFSVTMVFSLKEMSQELANYFNVDFWMYQEALNHDAKLVIQADGENINYWNGFDLTNIAVESNRWVNYHQKITVPDEIKQADIVKIYIYNPSKVNIYIDDFSMKIEP